VAEPVRPYEEKSGSGTHELYNKQTGEAVPDTEFSPRNTADQLTRLQDYVNHGQHGMSAQDAAAVFSVRSTDSDDTASAFTSPPAPPGRPNDPNGRYAIVPRSDPALYGSSTGGTPDYQFRFNMGDPAAQAQGRYVLQAWAARNNVVAADYMVVDTEQWDRPADAASGGIIDVEPDIEVVYPGSTADLAQQRAAPGTFSGAWKVLVNGEEVYRFSGVGNNQSDANRVAAQWLRNNGRGVSGEGFEVYPIMTESVAEAFDQPYKTKTEKSDYGDVDMLARLPDGTNLSIMFNKQQNNEGEETIQVEFYRNNSQEVTGEGDAQKIFATVLTSIQKYIKKYKPARLSFSASKATDPTIYYEPDQPQPNPESRAKLYDRLVQRYARAWGYRAFRADTGDLVIYELSRLQPAVAEGKDRYGNFDPPGPESPPTMPAGTVRVDVSDVYDWYKLGQHISNMKGLGKHDFGKGPPSAIISFGDEDLEHQYIQALKKTGLTTTDIDPVDPNQPPGMPRQTTDPTYNVDENFADGKNPGRKGLSKRVGVNTKASVSSLRKTAKNSSGEKQRMAHWLANMKAGRAKAKRK
jgi:hypothetical protein